MDSSAIETLRQSALIQTANEHITSKIDGNVVALPSDFKIHNLEHFKDLRARFRGRLETKSIPAFADYAIENTAEGATTFIDADTMKAKLIIDLGNNVAPGHAEHTASITLEKTAPFLALLGIAGQRKTQQEIAEFIEDWRNLLTAAREEDESGSMPEVSIVKAIHAVRKISIEAIAKNNTEVKSFGAATTSMESIDVKSDEMPPAYFFFTCEPYAGLPMRTFILRLSIITERTPALVLRIVKLEEHQELMAAQFQEIIESSLEAATPKIKTYVGTFAT